jgi:DNA-directed RNA polymerase specialized sigma24 family protein
MDRHTPVSRRDWEGMSPTAGLRPPLSVLHHASAKSADAPSSLEDALEDDGVRELVSSTVRRAVPALDADDVAQGVFCDALGTRTLPSNPLEIPYWLVGIARHHIANYFRRRPREVFGVPADAPVAPPTFESREALGHVFARVGDDADAKKTLEWMVLEHEGIPLKSIAEAERVSPAAVRARVYRLRTRLRRELAYLVAGVLLVVGAGALVRHFERAEPSRREARSISAPSWLEGVFGVAEIKVESSAPPEVSAMIEAIASGATVSVHGSTIELRSPRVPGVRTLSVVSVGGARDGSTTVEARQGLRVIDAKGDAGGVFTFAVTPAEGTLVVQSTTDPYRAMFVLKRHVPQEREDSRN